MSEWYLYTFIACAVWSVVTGATLVSCFLEDEDYEALDNEQWQRDQDEFERQNF